MLYEVITNTATITLTETFSSTESTTLTDTVTDTETFTDVCSKLDISNIVLYLQDESGAVIAAKIDFLSNDSLHNIDDSWLNNYIYENYSGYTLIGYTIKAGTGTKTVVLDSDLV